MILIAGGAFQGKKSFVKARFGLTDDDILNGEGCALGEAFTARCIADYDALVKRLIDQKKDALAFTKELYAKNPDAIVLINEIGCGIIPLDKGERLRREEVGRAGCILAEHSSVVIRITCGIANVIKGRLL
ncbi:MAG: bifunctional adenosylcobinamide kinase/adenosylcobinamide-phosphate guanylyltransferase [Bacteroides sp.]|nr:bifunctional adenosylcobinamide kinase/adenosylcobinamide-phosphate guanylyltransferase [Eubacterium sp.]MCM1417855.1 bifunctional adenosylcobinamide kinase/adenosylcobinamide-phosphate guanylyltransferase [Roseburia sp.]MCM1461294.1 bifunctional adenosylcobinamide kinase/adenosylcobinamide-phosphate guanylyltransferase [Bacteroides sp.]